MKYGAKATIKLDITHPVRNSYRAVGGATGKEYISIWRVKRDTARLLHNLGFRVNGLKPVVTLNGERVRLHSVGSGRNGQEATFYFEKKGRKS